MPFQTCKRPVVGTQGTRNGFAEGCRCAPAERGYMLVNKYFSIRSGIHVKSGRGEFLPCNDVGSSSEAQAEIGSSMMTHSSPSYDFDTTLPPDDRHVECVATVPQTLDVCEGSSYLSLCRRFAWS